MSPSCSPKPFSMYALRYASGISFALSSGQTAASARARTLVERSVATTSSSQPVWPNAARRHIASVYGSSPVEQAALQMRTRRGRRPASPSAFHAGNTRSSRNSKWRGSRKKCVSLVQMASSIRTFSPSSATTRSKYSP
jgi:hypothetical protein